MSAPIQATCEGGVRCCALVCDDETLRADAERAKKEWQAVELNGESMSKRRSANEIWLAAYTAGRRAHERSSHTSVISQPPAVISRD